MTSSDRGPMLSAMRRSERAMSRAAQTAKVGVAGLALAIVYWLPVRRWFSRWGTTPEELARVMPGDALIPDPTDMSMTKLTVGVTEPPRALALS